MKGAARRVERACFLQLVLFPFEIVVLAKEAQAVRHDAVVVVAHAIADACANALAALGAGIGHFVEVFPR